ncbi:MAG: radical SAM protein [Planctomycetota bacterium]
MSDVTLSVNGSPLFSSSAVVTVDPIEAAIAERYLRPSEQEHRFTSTGVKFWKHRAAMEGYRDGTGHSVISTHIAPEGRCNLSCDYCSVTHRTFHSTIPLETIQDYVTKLKSRGLKAVILTGGGEPTVYKHFNELGEWLLDEGLDLALITNGTQFKRVSDRILDGLSWLRISMNRFEHWERRITVPMDRVGAGTVVGMSLCHSGDNSDDEFLEKVGRIADENGVSYVRVLPDCMLPQAELVREHRRLQSLFDAMPAGGKFFHQVKIHSAPTQCTCHQSFFRPYLSEEVDPESGEPGLVFPCDSVVLNDQAMKFKSIFAVCRPHEILDYLDGRIEQKFDATVHCTGCVFARTVNMLDDYVRKGEEHFDEFEHAEMRHENFV